MKLVAPCLIFLLLSACSVEPQPLNYGKDTCHNCKMILTDKKFGSEVITKKGKVFKFDDANCMLGFLNSNYLDESEIQYKLMVDYTQPGKLIPAGQAFFLKSDEIRSPMNSSIAAFESEQSMQTFKKEWNAIFLSWGELQTEYK